MVFKRCSFLFIAILLLLTSVDGKAFVSQRIAQLGSLMIGASTIIALYFMYISKKNKKFLNRNESFFQNSTLKNRDEQRRNEQQKEKLKQELKRMQQEEKQLLVLMGDKNLSYNDSRKLHKLNEKIVETRNQFYDLHNDPQAISDNVEQLYFTKRLDKTVHDTIACGPYMLAFAGAVEKIIKEKRQLTKQNVEKESSKFFTPQEKSLTQDEVFDYAKNKLGLKKFRILFYNTHDQDLVLCDSVDGNSETTHFFVCMHANGSPGHWMLFSRILNRPVLCYINNANNCDQAYIIQIGELLNMPPYR